jgi:tetratricopeptide (TPR) repeat protein
VDKSLTAFLEERPRPRSPAGRPVPRAIIFDQFEEMFTIFPSRWREQQEAFFRQVAGALEADPLLRCALVIREDHLAELDPFARLLPEDLRIRFRLERLREAPALRAVRGPLRPTGRRFAGGVAEELVKDLMKIRVQTPRGETDVVTGEFVEPVQLQVVCRSLWRSLPPDVEEITKDDLQVFGDVDQALEAFYERAIEAAARKPGAHPKDLRLLFEDHLVTPAGTRGTAYRGAEKTGGVPNAAVDVLEDLHLIRGDWRAGAHWYELTHDRFVEPIRASNRKFREQRQRTLLTVYAGVAGLIVLLILGWSVRNSPSLMAVQGTAADVAAAATQVEATAAEVAGAETQVVQQATEQAEKADHVNQGLDHVSQGAYNEAIAEYNKAIALDPDYALAYNLRGNAYWQLGDYRQAIKDYTTAIEKGYVPPSVPLRNRGLAYAEMGDYEQAIAEYDLAIKSDPDYAEAYNSRGFAYWRSGEYQQAIDDYNRAVELGHEPRSLPINNRGLAHAALGEYEQAIKDYTTAIELGHEPPSWPLSNRGLAHAALGDYQQAITDHTAAIELDPTYAEAYNNRGLAYVALGRHQQQAFDDYSRAIGLDPSYAQAYNNRGNVYRSTGDLESAMADYERAIELDPGYSLAYANRGQAHSLLGNYAQAFQDFDRALELDPDNRWAYFFRGWTYGSGDLTDSEVGDRERAIADLERFLELAELPADRNIVLRAVDRLADLRSQ